MSIPRVFVDQLLEPNGGLQISDSTAHYLVHVLRLRESDKLRLFDGRGNEFNAVLTNRRKHTVSLETLDRLPHQIGPGLRIVLFQALAKGEKMDWVIQKATELGVSVVQPIQTQRTVVRLDEKKKTKRLQHWHRVAISACEQCGRNLLPQIEKPRELLKALDTAEDGSTRIVLSPGGTARLTDLDSPNGAIVLLIGPEGGFEETEIHQAKAHGFEQVGIGPRILRTETAPIAALAIIQSLWGDL